MASSSSSDDNYTDPHRQFHNAQFAGLNHPGDTPSSRAFDPQFDIFEWYPRYQSCQRYFLDHSQHSLAVQALAAFMNILLPFQRQPFPVANSGISRSQGPAGRSHGGERGVNSPSTPSVAASALSLIPYLRRLIVTGMDFRGVLHGFFGDHWATGIGPLHEQERRNYLFAAKSGGWAAVKRDYDIQPLETVPFLRPLQGVLDIEIDSANNSWSEWLLMEDWLVGPRAPPGSVHTSTPAGPSRPT